MDVVAIFGGYIFFGPGPFFGPWALGQGKMKTRQTYICVCGFCGPYFCGPACVCLTG